jgi:NAD+ synthase (glutamine-hydrolysing)
MYNVNAGIPKTVVRFMIENFATHIFKDDVSACLRDIVLTPISPELKQNQATESEIGKYEINDFILYRFLVCGDVDQRIVYLLTNAFSLSEAKAGEYTTNFFKRFYSQQFKRQASPDAPKILEVALSSRSDFRMPSDVKR